MASEILNAWAAGIVDGEGYVTRRKDKKKRKTQPFVRVENTDKRILDVLSENYGGKVSLAIRKDRPHHKPCWYWQLCCQKCIRFLLEIEPYLISKREKAKYVITGQQIRQLGA